MPKREVLRGGLNGNSIAAELGDSGGQSHLGGRNSDASDSGGLSPSHQRIYQHPHYLNYSNIIPNESTNMPANSQMQFGGLHQHIQHPQQQSETSLLQQLSTGREELGDTMLAPLGHLGHLSPISRQQQQQQQQQQYPQQHQHQQQQQHDSSSSLLDQARNGGFPVDTSHILNFGNPQGSEMHTLYHQRHQRQSPEHFHLHQIMQQQQQQHQQQQFAKSIPASAPHRQNYRQQQQQQQQHTSNSSNFQDASTNNRNSNATATSSNVPNININITINNTTINNNHNHMPNLGAQSHGMYAQGNNIHQREVPRPQQPQQEQHPLPYQRPFMSQHEQQYQPNCEQQQQHQYRPHIPVLIGQHVQNNQSWQSAINHNFNNTPQQQQQQQQRWIDHPLLPYSITGEANERTLPHHMLSTSAAMLSRPPYAPIPQPQLPIPQWKNQTHPNVGNSSTQNIANGISTSTRISRPTTTTANLRRDSAEFRQRLEMRNFIRPRHQRQQLNLNPNSAQRSYAPEVARVDERTITAYYFRRNGFDRPIIASESDHLDMFIPFTRGKEHRQQRCKGGAALSTGIEVQTLVQAVGKCQDVPLLHVPTQKHMKMPMAQWAPIWAAAYHDTAKDATVRETDNDNNGSSNNGKRKAKTRSRARRNKNSTKKKGSGAKAKIIFQNVAFHHAPYAAEQQQQQQQQQLLCTHLFEVSRTRLGGSVLTPKVVRDLDLTDTAWPGGPKHLLARRTGNNRCKYPRTQLYCVMAVPMSYSDFHVAPSGASRWLHVVVGSLVCYLVNPHVKDHLRTYFEWQSEGEGEEEEEEEEGQERRGSGSSYVNKAFFGDVVGHEHVTAVHMREGETIFVPGGWAMAWLSPCRTLAFSGLFMHGLGTKTQLDIYRMEKLNKRFINRTAARRQYVRFPQFVYLMWHTAHVYTLALRHVMMDDDEQEADSEDGDASNLLWFCKNEKKTIFSNNNVDVWSRGLGSVLEWLEDRKLRWSARRARKFSHVPRIASFVGGRGVSVCGSGRNSGSSVLGGGSSGVTGDVLRLNGKRALEDDAVKFAHWHRTRKVIWKLQRLSKHKTRLLRDDFQHINIHNLRGYSGCPFSGVEEVSNVVRIPGRKKAKGKNSKGIGIEHRETKRKSDRAALLGAQEWLSRRKQLWILQRESISLGQCHDELFGNATEKNNNDEVEDEEEDDQRGNTDTVKKGSKDRKENTKSNERAKERKLKSKARSVLSISGSSFGVNEKLTKRGNQPVYTGRQARVRSTLRANLRKENSHTPLQVEKLMPSSLLRELKEDINIAQHHDACDDLTEQMSNDILMHTEQRDLKADADKDAKNLAGRDKEEEQECDDDVDDNYTVGGGVDSGVKLDDVGMSTRDDDENDDNDDDDDEHYDEHYDDDDETYWKGPIRPLELDDATALHLRDLRILGNRELLGIPHLLHALTYDFGVNTVPRDFTFAPLPLVSAGEGSVEKEHDKRTNTMKGKVGIKRERQARPKVLHFKDAGRSLLSELHDRLLALSLHSMAEDHGLKKWQRERREGLVTEDAERRGVVYRKPQDTQAITRNAFLPISNNSIGSSILSGTGGARTSNDDIVANKNKSNKNSKNNNCNSDKNSNIINNINSNNDNNNSNKKNNTNHNHNNSNSKTNKNNNNNKTNTNKTNTNNTEATNSAVSNSNTRDIPSKVTSDIRAMKPPVVRVVIYKQPEEKEQDTTGEQHQQHGDRVANSRGVQESEKAVGVTDEQSTERTTSPISLPGSGGVVVVVDSGDVTGDADAGNNHDDGGDAEVLVGMGVGEEDEVQQEDQQIIMKGIYELIGDDDDDDDEEEMKGAGAADNVISSLASPTATGTTETEEHEPQLSNINRSSDHGSTTAQNSDVGFDQHHEGNHLDSQQPLTGGLRGLLNETNIRKRSLSVGSNRPVDGGGNDDDGAGHSSTFTHQQQQHQQLVKGMKRASDGKKMNMKKKMKQCHDASPSPHTDNTSSMISSRSTSADANRSHATPNLDLLGQLQEQQQDQHQHEQQIDDIEEVVPGLLDMHSTTDMNIIATDHIGGDHTEMDVDERDHQLPQSIVQDGMDDNDHSLDFVGGVEHPLVGRYLQLHWGHSSHSHQHMHGRVSLVVVVDFDGQVFKIEYKPNEETLQETVRLLQDGTAVWVHHSTASGADEVVTSARWQVDTVGAGGNDYFVNADADHHHHHQSGEGDFQGLVEDPGTMLDLETFFAQHG